MKTWKVCGASMVGLSLFVAGCSSDSSEATGSSDDALVLSNGAGAGPELYAQDPCENPAAFASAHGFHLIVAASGEHNIVGTNGPDLIVGTGGDDTIHAEGGADIVCAGYGEDTVFGGDGDDYIDGGGDNDTLNGEAGNDLIHGRGGSDTIHGGDDDDEIFGDILDDTLYGDSGDDLLIGGHGTDVMFGGDGNDFMRGDTGNDAFIGGNGKDVASFATAMPPGQPEEVGGKAAPTGVKVDFKDDCAAAGDVGNGVKTHDGCAYGDGANEPLDSIEIVIGSPYDDVFISDATTVRYIGGYGNDTCDGTACGTALPAGAENKIFVTLDDTARDVGLIVHATDAAENINIVRDSGGFRVVPVSATLFAGPGCHADGAAVECGTTHVLRYVAAWMGDGNDTVNVAESASTPRAFPNDMTAHVNGGDGDDALYGGDEQDVLFSGPTGRDRLFGYNGGDALLSESRKWPAKTCTPAEAATDPHCDENKPDAVDYTDGTDELYGGPGDDQLVADYPCGSHYYSGGGGEDIAGFARSGSFDIKAQLGGAATITQSFHGLAFNPQLCDESRGTQIEGDLEILEASSGNDELWGNDAPNTIWGREGNDVIHGLGGDDTLLGLEGNDSLYGGAGFDTLNGGTGTNQIFQDAN